ncbi:9391_t:CDS:2, partial [Rhizophagus irregularis]
EYIEDTVCDLYLMYIYEKIMKIRCEEVVSFEKSQGIGKLDKRQRNGVINELDMEGGIKF